MPQTFAACNTGSIGNAAEVVEIALARFRDLISPERETHVNRRRRKKCRKTAAYFSRMHDAAPKRGHYAARLATCEFDRVSAFPPPSFLLTSRISKCFVVVATGQTHLCFKRSLERKEDRASAFLSQGLTSSQIACHNKK